MTQQRDGGPAFPVTLLTSQDTVDKDGKKIGKINMPVQYPGMNLRDWFAGQALLGSNGLSRLDTARTLPRCLRTRRKPMLRSPYEYTTGRSKGAHHEVTSRRS